jgi:hypothetical protein
MKDEWERMQKELVVVCIKLLSWNLFGGTEENHKITSVGIVDIPADIQIGHLPI